jgi:hypothetical protein
MRGPTHPARRPQPPRRRGRGGEKQSGRGLPELALRRQEGTTTATMARWRVGPGQCRSSSSRCQRKGAPPPCPAHPRGPVRRPEQSRSHISPPGPRPASRRAPSGRSIRARAGKLRRRGRSIRRVPAQRRPRARRRPPRKSVSMGGSSSSPQRTRTWRRRRRLGREGRRRGCLGPGLHGRELDLRRVDLEQQRRHKGEEEVQQRASSTAAPDRSSSPPCSCSASPAGEEAAPGSLRPHRVGELERRRGCGGRAASGSSRLGRCLGLLLLLAGKGREGGSAHVSSSGGVREEGGGSGEKG